MTTAMDSVAFAGFIRFISRTLSNTLSTFASELNIEEDIEWEGVMNR